MKYIAMYRGCWGKGSTRTEALAQLREESHNYNLRIKDVSIYECPDDYIIDEYGSGYGSGPLIHISGPDLRS